MSFFSVGLLAIVFGIVLYVIGRAGEKKQRAREGVMLVKFENEKEREMQSIRLFQTQYPNIIPAVPEGVSALEFQGWFKEANRRLETWAMGHRSSADMALRIQLQKQINDLEEEWLRNQKTRSEIDLVKHRHAAEIAKLERETAEAQDQTAQIKERAEQRKNPPSKPEPAARLGKIERVAQVKEHAARNLAKYPDDLEIQELIKRKRDDDIMRIMEGPE